MEEENQSVVRELWQLRAKYSSLEKAYNELLFDNQKIKKERDDYRDSFEKLQLEQSKIEKSILTLDNYQNNPIVFEIITKEKQELNNRIDEIRYESDQVKKKLNDIEKQNVFVNMELDRLKKIELEYIMLKDQNQNKIQGSSPNKQFADINKIEQRENIKSQQNYKQYPEKSINFFKELILKKARLSNDKKSIDSSSSSPVKPKNELSSTHIEVNSSDYETISHSIQHNKAKIAIMKEAINDNEPLEQIQRNKRANTMKIESSPIAKVSSSIDNSPGVKSLNILPVDSSPNKNDDLIKDLDLNQAQIIIEGLSNKIKKLEIENMTQCNILKDVLKHNDDLQSRLREQIFIINCYMTDLYGKMPSIEEYPGKLDTFDLEFIQSVKRQTSYERQLLTEKCIVENIRLKNDLLLLGAEVNTLVRNTQKK